MIIQKIYLQVDEATGNQRVNDDNDNLQDHPNSDEETRSHLQDDEPTGNQHVNDDDNQNSDEEFFDANSCTSEEKDKNQNTEEGLRNQGSGASSQQLQWLNILKIIGCVVGVLSVIGLCVCVPLLFQPSPPCICNDTLISTPPMDLTTTTQMPERYTTKRHYTTESPSFPTKVITSDPDSDLIKSFTIDILKAVKEVGSSQVDDSVNEANKSLKLDIIKHEVGSNESLQGTKVYTLLISYSIRENTTWMLDFEKQVDGVRSSHIASSNDKTKLVDLNIEKKINGFVNAKDVSPDTNPKENNYFLDFEKGIIGVVSAKLSPLGSHMPQEADHERS
jgi:hypothetical protein